MMEKPNLRVFSGTLVSIDGGRQLAIARNLVRLYEDVLQEPLPCDLRRLIAQLEERSSGSE
jgi:hypothetical protein